MPPSPSTLKMELWKFRIFCANITWSIHHIDFLKPEIPIFPQIHGKGNCNANTKKFISSKQFYTNNQRQFIWLQVYLFLKRSLHPVFIRSISSFRFVCIEPVLYIYPINNYSSIFQLGIHWLNPEFKLLNSSFFSVNVELRLIIWNGGFRLNIFSKKFALSTPIFCKIYVVWLVWTV